MQQFKKVSFRKTCFYKIFCLNNTKQILTGSDKQIPLLFSQRDRNVRVLSVFQLTTARLPLFAVQRGHILETS